MQRSQSWIIPTVMSPEKGGPVYNQLRANFAYTRRMIQRHPFRWIHDNWDFERQALVNVPEPNLEIRKTSGCISLMLRTGTGSSAASSRTS